MFLERWSKSRRMAVWVNVNAESVQEEKLTIVGKQHLEDGG